MLARLGVKPRHWDAFNVRALRQHPGFTQAQLARKLGVVQQTVSAWECGDHTPTRLSAYLLDVIAEKYGFEYEDVIAAGLRL